LGDIVAGSINTPALAALALLGWLNPWQPAAALALCHCPAEGTVVELLEIDPAVHAGLADLARLRDGFPASTRRRPQTWTYAKSSPAQGEAPPVCIVTQAPAEGASRQVRLEAGLLPEVTDPNADQVFRDLATELAAQPDRVARRRTPIIRADDPLVGSQARAALFTRLGIAPARGPMMPQTMPAPTDWLLWQEGRVMLELTGAKPGDEPVQRLALLVRRCETELLSPSNSGTGAPTPAKVAITSFWLDAETGALLRRHDSQPGLRNPFTGRCATAGPPASGTGLAAIRLVLPGQN
jgi:hypothetical protein